MNQLSIVVGLLLLNFVTLKGVNGQISWADSTSSENVCEAHDINLPVYTINAAGSSSIIYSILNEDTVPFKMCNPNINNNGSVCLKHTLDYEVVKHYTVTEAAEDQGTGTKIQRLKTIHVQDDNDNNPLFERIPFIYERNESYAGQNTSVKIADIKATDPDNGWAGAVILTLQDNAGGLFRLSGGELFIEKPLDFETGQIHTGVVKATDRGYISGGCTGVDVSKSSRQNIYLNVIDAPDTKPFFLAQKYTSNVQENSKKLNPELVVEARDGDFDINWLIKYSLAGADDLFTINENNGTISIVNATKIDRESFAAQDGYYELTVLAEEIDPGTTKYDNYPGAQNSTITVTIFVEDINDNIPKFYSGPGYSIEQTSYVVNVSENSNTIPEFRIYVKDIDQPENAQFSLNLTGMDSTYFRLSQSNAVSQAILTLDVRKPLDYEEKDVLIFKIEAYEDGLVSSASITVNLIDENDNFPEFEPYSDNVFIAEQSPVGTNVTLVKAIDKDSSQFGPISYRLLPADSGFNISDEGLVYVSDEDLDREVRGQFYLTIIAEDGGGLVATTQLTVNLKDINDHEPAFLQSQYLINWDENDDSLKPVIVQATDRDKAGTVNSDLEVFVNNSSSSYNITQTASNGAIVADITPKDKLDTEEMDGFCSSGIVQYVFEVAVRDKGSPQKQSTAEVTVLLRDINDHTPYFNATMYYGKVPEESKSDTFIAKVFAKDDDKCSPNNDITYTVADAFSDKFLMRASNDGVWSLTVRDQSLDHNVQDVYNVIVYAVDSGQPRRTGNTTVKVTITDINNKLPFFNATESDGDLKVNETADIGTVVGKVVANDLDDNSILQYSITRVFCTSLTVGKYNCSEWFNVTTENQVNTKQRDMGAPPYKSVFAFCASDYLPPMIPCYNMAHMSVMGLYNPNYVVCSGETLVVNMQEGVIRVQNKLDREKVQTVSLTIQVKDLQGYKPKDQRTEWTMTIEILDYNDNPPEFSNRAISFTVVEEGNNTVIGRISATDKDFEQTVTFSTKSKYIKISEDGEVRVGDRIDREGDPGDNFTAVILAADNGTPSLTSNITAFFKVSDINDNDPVFEVTNVTCEVSENLEKDTYVCQYIATDKDIGDNGRISYSLNPSNNFIVETATGIIKTSQTFDRESTKSYQLKLQAKDDAGELYRVQVIDVTINILDVDDNDPNYQNYAEQEVEITEGNDEGQSLGFIEEAYDADTNKNQKNSYFLVYKQDNNTQRKFRLNMATRELFATETLDREKNSSYMLYVLATKNDSVLDNDYDHHDPNIILPVRVIVKDINDNAPKFLRSLYSTDSGCFCCRIEQLVNLLSSTNHDENDVVTVVSAIDPDVGENSTLVYSLLSEEYVPPDATTAVEQTNNFVISNVQGRGQIKLLSGSFSSNVVVGSFFRLRIHVEDGGGLSDDATVDVKIFDETETVILTSWLSVETVISLRDNLERDLEDAINADVVIDNITPHQDASQSNPVPAARATATKATALPRELDTVENNQLLADYRIVSITTSNDNAIGPGTETDLLKTVLVAVSCALVLFLVVLVIAFVCMRNSYKRKIKVAIATGDGVKSLKEQMTSKGSMDIPGTNKHATGESVLYLEDQKGNVDMAYLQQESNDDNSIDDNVVDSQDSAISEDHQGYQQMDDDLGEVEIDFKPGGWIPQKTVLRGSPEDSSMGGSDVMLIGEFGYQENTAM